MMKLIAHRGLINGPDKKLENNPSNIKNIILNYNLDIEIDIFINNDKIYLGHDKPQYLIDIDFLNKYKNNLWIHCKNIESLNFMQITDYNFFWHEEDEFTLTSYKYIWSYPRKIPLKGSICVLPENFEGWKEKDYSESAGICSDYISVFI